ncbi:hypothetical protein [Streptomyces sp. NPDC057702]|uniref:hypothetical protein n=1 Tax=unclassified Streptomyces TaxID=2593676 RepID=UPI0036991964
MTENDARNEAPDVLRQRMVAGLRARGAISSREVEAAFHAVPRDLFAPETSPEEAYAAPEAMHTKSNAAGRRPSSMVRATLGAGARTAASFDRYAALLVSSLARSL